MGLCSSTVFEKKVRKKLKKEVLKKLGYQCPAPTRGQGVGQFIYIYQGLNIFYYEKYLNFVIVFRKNFPS